LAVFFLSLAHASAQEMSDAANKAGCWSIVDPAQRADCIQGAEGGSAQAAVAGPFEEADFAYDRQDYATALQIWRPLADQGNARAQYNLGVAYAAGNGVPQDYVQAVSWWRKAAEQGFVKAQYNLGNAYAQGHGVSQDSAESANWFNKATEDFLHHDVNADCQALVDNESQITAGEWRPCRRMDHSFASRAGYAVTRRCPHDPAAKHRRSQIGSIFRALRYLDVTRRDESARSAS